MNRFIEVLDRNYGPHMVNIDNISTLSETSCELVLNSGKRFKIRRESFDKLMIELRKPMSDTLSERLCMVQNDLTIAKQVIANIYVMLEDTTISPSLLGKVNDAELQSMAAKCYTGIRKLQNKK